MGVPTLQLFHVILVSLVISLLTATSTADRTLYVCPDNHTLYPTSGDECLTLSEYVLNLSHFLDRNTTFVFLPGDHELVFNFLAIGTEISPQSILKLVASDSESNTTVTCTNTAVIILQEFSAIDIRGLRFLHCHVDGYGVAFIFIGSLKLETCTMQNSSLTIWKTPTLCTSCMFYNNSANYLSVTESAITIVNSRFVNNFLDPSYPVEIFIFSSTAYMEGMNWFHGNTENVIVIQNSSMILKGFSVFSNNKCTDYVMLVTFSNITIEGEMQFLNNEMQFSAVLTAQDATINIKSNLTFTGNVGGYGGGINLIRAEINIFPGSSTQFVNNCAMYGGGMHIDDNAVLNFKGSTKHTEYGTLLLDSNTAIYKGGGMYVQSPSAYIYCIGNVFGEYPCFFQVDKCDSSLKSPIMKFVGNNAKDGGDAVYGGAIDHCGIRTGSHCPGGWPFFNNITGYEHNSSKVASDPYEVSICEGTVPNQNVSWVKRSVYPGGILQISVVAFGQYSGIVPTTISATPTHGLYIRPLETIQASKRTCTNLTYTISGLQDSNGTLELAAVGPCLGFGDNHHNVATNLTVIVEIQKCPPGFEIGLLTEICECDRRLQEYTNSCNITDETIIRDSPFWAAYDASSDGLIVYPNCPLDFCVKEKIQFNVQDSDKQCSSGRVGVLCGHCLDKHSLYLGTLRCDRCSDRYLSLLLAFAVAGVALVLLLFLLNLTVASGHINGLIFYANIVAANDAIFFPDQSNGYVAFLKVFIAWLNLDIGIEMCFYNGMDAYAYTWLQFAFPLYIWTLVCLLIVASHFSRQISRLLGNNPVAVLATLIILSYTKILRTIIVVLAPATLEYPHGHTKNVWLFDGNVPFFDTKHTILFVFSLTVLFVLFIPYTVVLLASQWMMKISHWRILTWMNRPQFHAFLDAYHGPHKPKHRYWNGLLLLVRLLVFLTSAINTLSQPGINLLVIATCVLIIIGWQVGFVGGVYNKWSYDSLDTFFMLDLVFLAIGTFYVNSKYSTSYQLSTITEEGQRAQAFAISILVTLSLAVFLTIIVRHIYTHIRKTCFSESCLGGYTLLELFPFHDRRRDDYEDLERVPLRQ